MKEHWYFITLSECPVCGRSEETRERRYDKRPERWEDRHEYADHYDYCDYAS